MSVLDLLIKMKCNKIEEIRIEVTIGRDREAVTRKAHWVVSSA